MAVRCVLPRRLKTWLFSGWFLGGLILGAVAAICPYNNLMAGGRLNLPSETGPPPATLPSASSAGQAQPPDDLTLAGLDYSRTMTDSECMGCHRIELPDLNHPVDVPAGPHVPDYMPLVSGRITCTTCHRDTLAEHGRSRQVHDGLLRGGLSGSTFCAQCHVDSTDRTQFHALSLGRAHLAWDQPADPASPTGALDRETRQCIGCHDGSVGKDIGVSHPVGIAYRKRIEAYRLPTSRRRLTPVSRLDKRIRLFDGQVGCGSCHSHYSSLPANLVMSNQRSRLCRSCHAGY